MANTGAPNSTDAQFFITNGTLSQSVQQAFDFNFTIFGQLVSGQQTVTDLSKVAVQNNSFSPPEDSQPITPVVINSVALSSTNPNGVLHIDTTSATAGQTATITVTATDPTDHTTATQNFTVTVGAYNGPTSPVINFVPFANPVSASTSLNAPVTVQLAGKSGYPNSNYTGTSYQLFSQPAHGTISQFNATTGTLVYTPNNNFSGPDTFQYKVVGSGPQSAPNNIPSQPGTVSVSTALKSIALTPANPSIAKGLTEQFTATGTYADGTTADLTKQVTWASATASVATISNVVGTQGLASTLATGTTVITATLGGVTSPGDTLTVTAAALKSIALTPANPSIIKGLTEQFTATGTNTDGTTADLTTQATWASATATVATISNAVGTQGLASTLATGTTVITATLGGVTSPGDTLTVTAAALKSIALTPANPSIVKGLTEQFTATGTNTDGTTADLTTQATWASATASVATISNAVGSQGLASTLATGTTVITASLGGVTSPGDTLTVTADTGAVHLIDNDVLVVTPLPRTDHGTDNIRISQVADSTVSGGQKIVVTVNGVPDTDPTCGELAVPDHRLRQQGQHGHPGRPERVNRPYRSRSMAAMAATT